MASFIGKYEIKSQETLENGRIRVNFKEYEVNEDQTFTPPSEEFTKEVYDLLVTKEASDANTVTKKRVEAMKKDIFEVFFKYNIYVGQEEGEISEIQRVFQSILQDLRDVRYNVDTYLYGIPEYKLSILKLYDHLLDGKNSENQKEIPSGK